MILDIQDTIFRSEDVKLMTKIEETVTILGEYFVTFSVIFYSGDPLTVSGFVTTKKKTEAEIIEDLDAQKILDYIVGLKHTIRDSMYLDNNLIDDDPLGLGE